MRKDKQRGREYKRLWRARNRDRINLQVRERRAADPERFREYQRRWQSANREQTRASYRKWWNEGGKFIHEEARLKRKYGIDTEKRELLFEEQHGRCAICGEPLVHWKQLRKARNGTGQIDHDHSTGKIRGLLCGNCNRGIALFRDDLNRLQNAIAYLKQHGRN